MHRGNSTRCVSPPLSSIESLTPQVSGRCFELPVLHYWESQGRGRHPCPRCPFLPGRERVPAWIAPQGLYPRRPTLLTDEVTRPLLHSVSFSVVQCYSVLIGLWLGPQGEVDMVSAAPPRGGVQHAPGQGGPGVRQNAPLEIYMAICRHLQPRYALLENVLDSPHWGRGARQALHVPIPLHGIPGQPPCLPLPSFLAPPLSPSPPALSAPQYLSINGLPGQWHKPLPAHHGLPSLRHA